MTTADDRYRLPQNAAPSHYSLRLEPDLDHATFTGEADITVEVFERSDQLVCNALELDVEHAELCDSSGATRRLTATLDPDLERATFSDGDPIGVGIHTPVSYTHLTLPTNATR